MTKQIRLFYAFLFTFSLLWTGCIKDSNPPLPAYVYVDNIYLEVANDGSQGGGSANIQDAWISVDGQVLGANTLPAVTFPVILDDNFPTNTIRISAGIAENGIANTRRIYPFYQPFEMVVDLEAGRTDTFAPVLTYDSTATIRIIEDFEPTGTVFSTDLDNNPNTFMRRQNTDVFEGNYSGEIVLDSANLECIVATSVKYSQLQPVGTSFPIYLEMDYKTNTALSVGIIAHYTDGSTQTTYIAGVNPNNTWNKIYFNLTETVFAAEAAQYSIVLQSIKSLDTDKAAIYVDNIKLLHF